MGQLSQLDTIGTLYATSEIGCFDTIIINMRFPTKWHFDKCIDSDKPVQPPFKHSNAK